MDADLRKVEQPVEQADVPVGRAPGADMAEDLGVGRRQVLAAQRGDGPGAHLGDRGGVQDRHRPPGARVEQVEDAELGRQALLVVVDEVADHLHPGQAQRRHVAAQHVEMAVEGRVRHQMHARLDDGLAPALGAQPAFDGGDDLLVGKGEFLDIQRVQPGDVEFRHASGSRARHLTAPCGSGRPRAPSPAARRPGCPG
jgi:hypothetical protein